MNPHIQKLISKGNLLRQQMWNYHGDGASRYETWGFALMRVSTITFAGLKENRLLSRAAALSFSSLLGLGPIIALMVLVSGFVLEKTQPDMAQKTIEDAIRFIAPQIAVGQTAETSSELGSLISRFIEASQSGAVGIGGSMMLIFIVIQLFSTIEEAFNDIWGVKRGRNIITRIFMYWSIITLGALLSFAGMAVMISETVKLTKLANDLNAGQVAQWISLHGAKAFGFVVISCVLTLFYRFIPNTQVEWKASLIGAAFTVICFAAINYFAFLYVEKIAMQRTLYGSLAFGIVLMIGFYFFWICLLLGGRVSFAVQNARFKGGRIVWNRLSLATQESLCLLVLIEISRQFRHCQKPLSANELAAMHRLPLQLISSALHRLNKLELVSSLPPDDHDSFDAYRYQPAKPLDRITLIHFKKAFESYGEAPDEDHFDNYDPIVKNFHERLNASRRAAFGEDTFESLLDQDESATRKLLYAKNDTV